MRLDRNDFLQLTGELVGEPTQDWAVDYFGHKTGMHFEQRPEVKHGGFIYWDNARRAKIKARALSAEFDVAKWVLTHSQIELVITEAPVPGLKGRVAQFVVPDTWRFYLEVAAYIRERYLGKVLTVTGSVGKTTTRLMLAQLMRASGHRVMTNLGNDNVRQVLPQLLTTLLTTPDAMVAELSIGALTTKTVDGFKNAPLSHNFEATTAIVTQIGGAHQRSVIPGQDDLTSSLKQDLATARVKGRIFEKMRPGGHAILNYDMHPQIYKLLQLTAQKHAQDLHTFSLHDPHADAYLVSRQNFRDYSELTLNILDETAVIRLALPGDGPVMDLLAACLAFRLQGWQLPNLTKAFQAFKPLHNELVFHNLSTTQGAVTLVEDTYNSTRHSVLNVLTVLKERGPFYHGPKVLVIETGDDITAEAAVQLNLSYVQPILDSGIDLVLGYRDPTIKPLIDALAERGQRAKYYPQMDALIDNIEALPEDAFVIVKGQHFKYGSDLRRLTPRLLKRAAVR
ncbi:hypothetical protein D1831_09545 [Lactiplantibacillus garii]|uniref:Mur ligase central domain-containing protein n=1 Tax=Lactiplantibacillus garii TaxID=2306423 RepID=A0A426D602_9LACO|nr:Mur ligase family protein [Lactiplantibacillus garii]RRK10052.1 hypothetical protein D1831_09545 [Lactiplantibacillus garii]